MRSQRVWANTYGIGSGIGNGSRIFLPPLSNKAAIAAFLSSFFLPASAPFGIKAARTMATTAKMAKILRNFILICRFVYKESESLKVLCSC